MQGKIITCCGDCVHYDWKKHKCKYGHNQKGTAQDHFYTDCTTLKDLEEHDREIYNRAIDDFAYQMQKMFRSNQIAEEAVKQMAKLIKKYK